MCVYVFVCVCVCVFDDEQTSHIICLLPFGLDRTLLQVLRDQANRHCWVDRGKVF